MRALSVLVVLAACTARPASGPTSGPTPGPAPAPPPLPLGRVEAEAVALGGVVYLLGGTHAGETLARVDAFDPVANAWTRRADMRTARSHFAAAALAGRIYALGGQSGACERYDPARDVWEPIAALPAARTHFAAAAHAGRVIAFGGVVERSVFSDDVRVYDPEADRWSAGPRLPAPRHGHCAVALADGIHVLGGTEDFRDFATHWVLAGERFEPRAPLPVGGLFFGAEVVGGKIVAFGGIARDAASYDPAGDRWTRLPPAPRPHYHLASAALGATFYAFGGARTEGDGPFARADVDALDLGPVPTWRSSRD